MRSILNTVVFALFFVLVGCGDGGPVGDANADCLNGGPAGGGSSARFCSTAGGQGTLCAVLVHGTGPTGSVVCSGQAGPFLTGSDFVEVAVSGSTVCGLRAAGTVACRDLGAEDGHATLVPPDPGPGGHLVASATYMCSHAPSGQPVCVSSTCLLGPCVNLFPPGSYSRVYVGTGTVCGLTAGQGAMSLVCSSGGKTATYTDGVETEEVAIEPTDVNSAVCWLDAAGHPHCAVRWLPPVSVQGVSFKKIVPGNGFMIGLGSDGSMVGWGASIACGGTVQVPNVKASDVVVASDSGGACEVCASNPAGDYSCVTPKGASALAMSLPAS